jgi:hypothetical protein
LVVGRFTFASFFSRLAFVFVQFWGTRWAGKEAERKTRWWELLFACDRFGRALGALIMKEKEKMGLDN